MLTLIAAMANHRVIGFQGGMPWHLPAELAYFKKITWGKPVLMGRRTFESIGKALPGRRNLIISRQPGLSLPHCEIYSSLDKAQQAISADEELMVIGGATLFQQCLPLAKRMYLTFIDCTVKGDVYFPEWDPQQWREVNTATHPADERNAFTFRTVELTRL